MLLSKVPQSARSEHCTHFSASGPGGNQAFNQESEHKNALLRAKTPTQGSSSKAKCNRNKSGDPPVDLGQCD